MGDILAVWKQLGDYKNYQLVSEVTPLLDQQSTLKINNTNFQKKNHSAALDNQKTTLTAWFDLNKMDVFAKNINYINISQYYVF